MPELTSKLMDGAGQFSYLAVASEYDKLRRLVTDEGPLSSREIALCSLAAFAAKRDDSGLRSACGDAFAKGIPLDDVQHVVLLLLGSSIGLSPTVDTLKLVREEFSKRTDER